MIPLVQAVRAKETKQNKNVYANATRGASRRRVWQVTFLLTWHTHVTAVGGLTIILVQSCTIQITLGALPIYKKNCILYGPKTVQ